MTKVNLPTVSSPAAQRYFSRVRKYECGALLEGIDFKNKQVLDIQSAAGFVSDTIFEKVKGHVNCVCLEPSPAHRQQISINHKAIDNPIENFYGVTSQSIDIAIGLAPFHHSENHLKTTAEIYRVLKKEGIFSCCEVIEGSAVAKWLNEFVHRHNDQGHNGKFISPSDLKNMLENIGFLGVKVDIKSVPWLFDNMPQCYTFLKEFFALNCTSEELAEAVNHYFNFRYAPNEIELEWDLVYARARK